MGSGENRRGLSGNALKLIAAVFMALDHIGLMFFLEVLLLRKLGRLAMPVFAFFIAEGCWYTRSRKRYFLSVFSLGAACQLVYFLAMGDTYMNILITFSLSILVIYALQDLKDALAQLAPGPMVRAAVILVLTVVLVWVLNRRLTIDYGFWGCMLPVWASLLQARGDYWRGILGKLDDPRVHALTMVPGLLLTWGSLGGVQGYSLLAVPLLLCYNGKRGSGKLKYFFYIFYPVHLALLQGIHLLLSLL